MISSTRNAYSGQIVPSQGLFGYGMNDDELQSYSTQIVPPQDLFGLGQEDTHVMPVSKMALLFGAGAVFGLIVGYAARDTIKNLLKT